MKNIMKMKCPYCGGQMHLGTKEEIVSPKADTRILICDGFPECNTYAELTEVADEPIIISTPADKALRLLRKEVRHYMLQATANGLFCSEDDAYAHILINIPPRQYASHIGEMREAACVSAIAYLIRTLYIHRFELKTFAPWYRLDNLLPAEVRQMKSEIMKVCRTKKRNMSPYPQYMHNTAFTIA